MSRAGAFGPAVMAFVAGLIFAAGLALGGMTRPEVVVGFLDPLGDWDPSLALVMAGALAVHFGLSRWVLRRPAPVLAARFMLPTRRDLTGRLVLGSLLFGLGWGLAGVCPGPGITAAATLRPDALLFVGAMFVGMASQHRLDGWLQRRRAVSGPASGTAQPAQGGRAAK